MPTENVELKAHQRAERFKTVQSRLAYISGYVDRAGEDEFSLNALSNISVHPPPGWFTFGTHIEEDVKLEFYGAQYTEDGLPLWERPVV